MNKEDKDFKTVHVEGIGDKSDRLTKEIKTILEGKEIKKLCDTTIRLIPQFDFKESIAFNEKVNVCITIQKQFMAQIGTMEVELNSVETIIKENNNKTLREHILDMNKKDKTPKALFVKKNGTIKDIRSIIPR